MSRKLSDYGLPVDTSSVSYDGTFYWSTPTAGRSINEYGEFIFEYGEGITSGTYTSTHSLDTSVSVTSAQDQLIDAVVVESATRTYSWEISTNTHGGNDIADTPHSLLNAFTAQEYIDVDSSDAAYQSSSGQSDTNIKIYTQFVSSISGAPDFCSITWIGKCGIATTQNTLYMYAFDTDQDKWFEVASDSVSAIAAEITISVALPMQYVDANGAVTILMYQSGVT